MDELQRKLGETEKDVVKGGLDLPPQTIIEQVEVTHVVESENVESENVESDNLESELLIRF